jgi:hypothetical protein
MQKCLQPVCKKWKSATACKSFPSLEELTMYANCSSKTWNAQNILLKLCTGLQKYLEQAQDLVFNENVLLQTLGFDVAIDHPHTHVVRCCHLVRGKCLAVMTTRGGKCKQQVYLLGLLKLSETVAVADTCGMELCVRICFCVPHCHQDVLPPVLIVRNLHTSQLFISNVFEFALMC